ncbi:MAG: DNA cytosine methyltransferase [Synergistaceae bacterium]|nr:DNA cytosine methyltransferase [Synergistaceae bacterium]
MNKSSVMQRPINTNKALDFFAGSGLVTAALSPWFSVVWANDVSPKKGLTYTANHGNSHFVLEDIRNIKGSMIPSATLAWASFPCQDLSLAGKIKGIYASRSGLVWEWLRILDELDQYPVILVAENVLGLLSSNGGSGYIDLHNALLERGYNVGPLLIDAKWFLPQSRPRVFVVAIRQSIPIDSFCSNAVSWAREGKVFNDLSKRLDNWAAWNIERPRTPKQTLKRYVDLNAPFPKKEWQQHNLNLIPQERLDEFASSSELIAAGYKRVRKNKLVLEIRFDGMAGCLRTPSGGSSKQLLIFKTSEGLKTRFITIREAARLMGAPDSYELPGSYLDGYTAMGDAVAAPVVRHLAKYLLYPLAEKARNYVSEQQKAI